MSYSSLQQIADPLENEVAEDIAILADTLELNKLADLIKYYDEVLTMSARNYAFTGDKKWEQRYNSVVPELDHVIKEAIKRGDQTDAKIFESVDGANLALVEMEMNALHEVSSGNRGAAVDILESEEYWDQKTIYNKGLQDYFTRRGSQSVSAVQDATIDIKLTTKNTRSLIGDNVAVILSILFSALLLAFIITYFTSRSISRPIKELTSVVDEVSQGNFEVGMPEANEINEIDDLIRSLGRIMKTMKLAVLEKGSISKSTVARSKTAPKVSKKGFLSRLKNKIASSKVSAALLDEAYTQNALWERGKKWAEGLTKKKNTKKRKRSSKRKSTKTKQKKA